MESNYNIDVLDNNLNNSIPTQIKIGEYIYTKNDIYKKGICYRCSNRSKCSLTIVITIDELKKLMNKDSNINVEYTNNSNQKTHTCTLIIKQTEENKNCMTFERLKELAYNMIKCNIDKDINFHNKSP